MTEFTKQISVLFTTSHTKFPIIGVIRAYLGIHHIFILFTTLFYVALYLLHEGIRTNAQADFLHICALAKNISNSDGDLSQEPSC